MEAVDAPFLGVLKDRVGWDPWQPYLLGSNPAQGSRPELDYH